MYSCRGQVDIVHVAVIGYFDELVQPTYTLSTQNQATGLWACLAMLVALTVRLITLVTNGFHVKNAQLVPVSSFLIDV